MVKYSTWLKTASVFQLVTGLIHSMSLFTPMQATNETEETMLQLMTAHSMDMGAGISRSMMNLFIALSSCFTFLYLLGGINNIFLLNKLTPSSMKNYLLINTLIFGICFGVMAFLTFLPPILLTGIVFVLLLLAWLTAPGKEVNVNA